MPKSRHVRMTRTAISPRFAIRIFLNMDKSVRSGDQEEQKNKNFGVPQVVFRYSGDNETRQRGDRTQNCPPVVFAVAQPLQEGTVEFDQQPHESSKTQKPALRGNLQEI